MGKSGKRKINRDPPGTRHAALATLPFPHMADGDSRLHKLKREAMSLWEEGFHPDKEPSRLRKFLHFWVLVIKSFNRNRCPVRASALSYTTLLALIPMLAVAMSVTTGVLKKRGKEQIEQFIEAIAAKMVPPAENETNAPSPSELPATNQSGDNTTVTISTNLSETSSNFLANQSSASIQDSNNIPSEPRAEKRGVEGESRLTAAQKKVADQIYGFVQKTQSSAIAGIGMLLLIYAAIQMLRQIESTFNDIWGITRGRGWWTSILLYWATISLGPILLIGAVGLASGPHFASTQKLLMEMPGVGTIIFKLLPLILLWLTFTLFYKTVPNTKVRFTAALVGGLVGGTAWHINNLLGFIYVSRVVSYSKMYGGLGLVPVFMLGLYFSWLFLLFGAQVAYAYQNRTLYLQERLAENVNQRGREFVALRLITFIGQRFQRGQRPPTVQELSDELGIPGRLVQQVLQTLIAAHLVIEIAGTEAAYTPARPLEQINAHHVLQAMRARGQELRTREEPVREEVYGEFARIEAAEKQAASSLTMLAMVNRADARLELAPPPAPEKAIEISPALVPHEKNEPTPPPQPEPPVEMPKAPEPVKPEPPVVVEAPTPTPRHVEEVPTAKPVAEPISDEERDFPL
jgi:membrane protein